jgi:hypothetical protein
LALGSSGLLMLRNTVDGMDVLADGDKLAFVEVDSVRRRALSATEQGAASGHADEVFADLINGPLNHLPSSAFEANVAWPQSAATAQAPSRTVGTLPQPVTPWRAAPPSAPS